MVYATIQDMINRFGEDEILLVADGNSDGIIDEAAVNVALDDAFAEIDLHVGTRYDLPLPDNMPARTINLLKRFACDIALFLLSNDTVGDSEKKEKNYNNAIKTLSKISEGKVKLAINTQDTNADGIEDAQADIAEFSGEDRLFTRTTMAGL